MKLKKVLKLLDAELITGHQDLEKEIKSAFAADLLSDILAIAQEGAMLITGVTHPQVVWVSIR